MSSRRTWVSSGANAIVALVGLVALVGCPKNRALPKTSSELVKGSSYLPLSPKPIVLHGIDKFTSQERLDALPNETMRISIGSLDETGSLKFGAGAVGQEGHSYEVVVDYIKYTTAYLPVCVRSNEVKNKGKWVAGMFDAEVFTALGSIKTLVDTRIEGARDAVADESSFAMKQRIPVYLGVGLRIQASVQVLKGDVNLTLFGLGAAASAGKVSGTMVVQTLGVFGSPISSLIPLPTDISQSSIQAAMQSLAAIKAKLYDDEVKTRPQIIGFETALAPSAAIQLIEATIAGSQVEASFENGELRSIPVGGEIVCDQTAKAGDVTPSPPPADKDPAAGE